ncbi:MAG: VWA domain-containing protein [Chroococcidiopsidaceae cyanobacterium CP_BM_ER_R8_30]|nr:VWA domain-containing protein [Chroococcidiopsidaceae cyanobacterium CP_BM_ER_R8_30]
MPETLRLEDVIEFAENPEPRCPCVLLLDASGSMNGAPIDALNAGLHTFKEELNRDDIAKKRVEVAIVSFNSEVEVVQDFVTADQFDPPTLVAGGLTHMGSGIHKALDLVQDRKAQYRNNGVAYYRPWVFLITDGEPQGESDNVVEAAAQRLQQEEESQRVAFFAVGVEDANLTRLSQIVVRTPLKLKGLNFQEMFIWLSASMQRVSQSQTNEQVPLPPPGWGAI